MELVGMWENHLQVEWDSGVGFSHFTPCGSSKAGCDQMIRAADSKFLSDSLLPVRAIYPEPSLTIWFSTYWSQFMGCPFGSGEHTLNQLEALGWSRVWCKSMCLCVFVSVCASRALVSSKKPYSPTDRVGCSASLGVLCGRCVFKVAKSSGTAVQESSQVLSRCYFKSWALPSSISRLRKLNRWGKSILFLIKHHLHWWYEDKYGVSTLQHVAGVLRIQKYLSFHGSK